MMPRSLTPPASRPTARLTWAILSHFVACFLTTGPSAKAQTIDPAFAQVYNYRDLGTVPGVPMKFGGLTFKAGDPDTILIGGDGNTPAAQIYAVKVTRSDNGHINGFTGTATAFASAKGPDTGGIDGGLTYGPSNVLFYTSYPENVIGQILPGAAKAAKFIPVEPWGTGAIVGSLAFVPSGFPGAGHCKILSYDGGLWVDALVTPDSSGGFELKPTGRSVSTGIDAEGAFFVKGGNPLFTKDSVLIADYSGGRYVAFELDDAGDPIPASLKPFLNDLPKAMGAAQDPRTGDFVFSSFQENHIYVVGGFKVDLPVVSFSQPTNGAAFVLSENINYVINASQNNGSLSKVLFYAGTNLVDTFTEPPYKWTFNPTKAGIYDLTAVAIGNGLSTTSAPVRIFVSPINNQNPTVELSLPRDGLVDYECAAFRFRAFAADPDGSVTQVDFEADKSVLLARTSLPPFEVAEVQIPVGTHRISAVAMDDSFGQTRSSSVQVTILPLPTHQLYARSTATNTIAYWFRGIGGTNYVFESTPTLENPSWKPFRTNAAPKSANGLFGWTDAAPSGPQSLFIRARQR